LKPDVWKKNNSGAPKESSMYAKKLSLQAQKNAKNDRSQKFTERDVVDENVSKEWHPKMKTRPEMMKNVRMRVWKTRRNYLSRSGNDSCWNQEQSAD